MTTFYPEVLISPQEQCFLGEHFLVHTACDSPAMFLLGRGHHSLLHFLSRKWRAIKLPFVIKSICALVTQHDRRIKHSLTAKPLKMTSNFPAVGLTELFLLKHNPLTFDETGARLWK